MKKKLVVAAMTALMVLTSVGMCFAANGDFELTSTYPTDGQKNTSMENLGVKLQFNHECAGKEAKEINKNMIEFKDEEGKTVPAEVLFSEKEKGLVLVIADTDYRVLNNAEYKLVVKKGFCDNEGNTLGKDKTVTFKTYNQKANNWVNMGMMAVMFGGIMVISMRAQNKDKEEKNSGKGKDAKKETFNPYKEAKRTGKTVEQVIAEENARQAKQNKKSKKNQASAEHDKIERCADYLNNVYHVSAPAPVNHADRSIKGLNAYRKEKKNADKASDKKGRKK